MACLRLCLTIPAWVGVINGRGNVSCVNIYKAQRKTHNMYACKTKRTAALRNTYRIVRITSRSKANTRTTSELHSRPALRTCRHRIVIATRAQSQCCPHAIQLEGAFVTMHDKPRINSAEHLTERLNADTHNRRPCEWEVCLCIAIVICSV